MKTILITGAMGFIGKNLIATLKTQTDFVIYPFDLKHSEKDLLEGIQACDFIIHLAGVNRPSDPKDFENVNVNLTAKLLEFLEKSNKNIPLLITSSTQATLDNPYGRSKKKMEDLVLDWASRTHNKAIIYRLTNVFGKWCRPNYNSAVATFCYNTAHGLPITLHDPERLIYLLYIDDVVKSFIDSITHIDELSTGFYSPTPTYALTLKEIVDKLKAFEESRKTLISPPLDNSFDKALYATYLSYLDSEHLSYPLSMNSDSRGWLSEFIKANSFGQIFISKTLPGVTRGNHWHHTKTEKFLVIQGSALIRLRSLDGGPIISYAVTGEKLEVIDIPPGYTHSIENTGQNELITLFWASEIFDPQHSDTFYEEVLP